MDELQLNLPLDSPLRSVVQNDRAIMAYHFFHLDRTPRNWPIQYDDGVVKVTVTGEAIATMFDLECMIYVISLMAQKMSRGESVDRQFHFAAGDFFRVAGWDDSGKSYKRMEEALDRLQGTKIRTNIVTGGERTKEGFSWLDNYKLVFKEDTGKLDRVSLTLCEWLWRAVKLDNNKFTYDPAYFDLPPLEKRLYEMARAHVGNKGFRMWIDRLQARVGCEDNPRSFKARLKKISQRRRPLPGYCFVLKECTVVNASPKRGRPAKRTMVMFFQTEKFSTTLLGDADAIPIVE
jgi:plasmid replication initiation protein